MWLRRLKFAAFMALTVPGAAMADQSAQALAMQLLAESGAPGIGVAMWQNGQADIAVAGLRARGDDTPIGVDDLWHIGSNTKSMTAMLIARLAAGGLVDREDTIGAALGGQIAGINPAYSDTGFEALLNHRSGLPANLGIIPAIRLQGAAETRDILADRRAYAANVLARAPGEIGAFSYSNAGYVIAGAMLEARLGERWEALIRAHLFAPLGMESAGFGAPGDAVIVDQPRGHRRTLLGNWRAVAPGPGADNIPALGPAGTVHASLTDMLAYLRAHLEESPDILPPEAWAWLHEPVAGADYVGGWAVHESVRVHTGSNTMWYMLIAYDRQRQRALVLAANSGDIARLDPLFGQAARAVLGD